MNANQEEQLRQERVQQAARVKARADEHKVCLICTSVSLKTARVCPVCHAYQWDETPEAVGEAVDLAALSVFPVTLGYAPSTKRNLHFLFLP